MVGGVAPLVVPLSGKAQLAGRMRMLAILISALFLLAVTHAGPSAAQDRHSAQRARMVAEIAAIARETGEATGRPRLSDTVMTAMGKVPRHLFVPPLQQAFAYANRALPIGEGQTISQPFLVALMTDLLDPKPGTPCWKSARARAIRLRSSPNSWRESIRSR